MKNQNRLLYDTNSVNVFYKLQPTTDRLITGNVKLKLKRVYTLKIFALPETLRFTKFTPTRTLLSRIDNRLTINSVIEKQPTFATFVNFDYHFLKKEKLYTKLKYSRSPQYDIVSGGVAALFSAFIGFLISEKFGIELVDSGDFYTLFMYVVFLTFSLRPLVKIISKFDKLTPVFSLLPILALARVFGEFTIYKIVKFKNKCMTLWNLYLKYY